jgi:hypothetical protein
MKNIHCEVSGACACAGKETMSSTCAAVCLPSDKHVEVKMSTIPNAGLGLFAKHDFSGPRETKLSRRSGDKIALYTGKLVRRQDCPERLLPTGTYVLQLNRDLAIDAADPETPGLGRWANTCTAKDIRAGLCKSNNACLSYSARNPALAFLRATRSIKKGEEIFNAYGNAYGALN